MRRLCLAFIVTYSLFAFAKEEATDCTFALSLSNPLTFRYVEMISRNHSVGLHREADLRISPWIDIGPRAYLGVDQMGRAVQVLKLQDRTVALLLSGQRQIKELFFRHPNELFALDEHDRWLQFSWSKWGHSDYPQILKTAGAGTLLGTVCGALALGANSYLASTPALAIENLMAMGLAAVTSATLSAHVASAQYEAQNEMTDGFSFAGLSTPQFRFSEPIRNEEGSIVDIALHSKNERTHLSDLIEKMELPQTKQKGFAYDCEHELLPRGIPSRQYDP